ncbi:membrane protease subunit HflK [Prosthecomicrobium pneumaticum]|uniref:Protein HflK n=1 Tax=Prosthecomicrobium pneumaticum TaxID=81895 RepID=A0A7W9FQJ8_9HYPH|nr:membrane protease subunit HflK [Prosthecomicrobium pneumaticum]
MLPGGGGGTNPALFAIVVIAIAAFLGYSFFTFRVEPDEVGVVLRFGKVEREQPPGLNWRLPYPIETVETPKVTRTNSVSVGIVMVDGAGGAQGRDVEAESLMLTGDENIVDIDFTVFWQIKDARDYLFNIQNPDGTVKAAAESAMREVVGRSDIQPILTQARQITETQVQDLLQETLDEYGAGIQINQVQLQKVDPPAEVIDAFRDVQAARADQERLQNEAQTYANRVIPEARGQAAQIVQAANAYRDQTIAEARGQADRFVKVFESYRAAPDVTRRRIYMETMEKVLGTTENVLIDERGAAENVVPYLPLEPLNRTPAAAPATGGQP